MTNKVAADLFKGALHQKMKPSGVSIDSRTPHSDVRHFGHAVLALPRIQEQTDRQQKHVDFLSTLYIELTTDTRAVVEVFL